MTQRHEQQLRDQRQRESAERERQNRARQAELDRQQAYRRQQDNDRLQALQRQQEAERDAVSRTLASPSAGLEARSGPRPLADSSCISLVYVNQEQRFRNACGRDLRVSFCNERKVEGTSRIGLCGADIGGFLLRAGATTTSRNPSVPGTRVHWIACPSDYPFAVDLKWTGSGLTASGCSN